MKALITDSNKKALVFIFLSLVTTALIGAGLSRLEFSPGMPIPFFESGQVIIRSADERAVGMPVSSFAEIILMSVFGVCVLVVMIQAARGVGWKRVVLGLLSLLWKLLLAAVLLFLVIAFMPVSQRAPQENAPPPSPKLLETAPLGPAPAILIWLVGLVLSAAIIFLVARMILAKVRQGSDSLEKEAEKARQALLAGGDLRTVILRCYRDMGLALKQERDIERDAFMTTGEFEGLLIAKGIPYEPVHRLTRLFEAVRYGRWKPEPADERGALGCLEAIIEAGRRSDRAGMK
jgi:large-conductance mechanosensitive channel